MLTLEFLKKLKQRTEDAGGHRWLPGLSKEQIAAYEKDMGFSFPKDVKLMMGFMNGCEKKFANDDAWSGPYSYPRDMHLIKERLEIMERESKKATYDILPEQIKSKTSINYLPFFLHRYIVCTEDPMQSPVVSAVGNDVIVYGDHLREYLYEEFLKYI